MIAIEADGLLVYKITKTWVSLLYENYPDSKKNCVDKLIKTFLEVDFYIQDLLAEYLSYVIFNLKYFVKWYLFFWSILPSWLRRFIPYVPQALGLMVNGDLGLRPWIMRESGETVQCWSIHVKTWSWPII